MQSKVSTKNKADGAKSQPGVIKNANAQHRLMGIDQSWLPYIFLSVILSLGAAISLNYVTSLPQLFILGGVVGLFLAIIVFQHPEVGAYLLIFFVFTNTSDLFTEKGLPSVNKPLIAITAMSILVHFVFKTEKRIRIPKLTRTELALLSYFIVISASTLVASDRILAFGSLVDLLKDVAVGLCVVITLNTKPKLKTGVSALLIAIALVSFLGIIKTLTAHSLDSNICR